MFDSKHNPTLPVIKINSASTTPTATISDKESKRNVRTNNKRDLYYSTKLLNISKKNFVLTITSVFSTGIMYLLVLFNPTSNPIIEWLQPLDGVINGSCMVLMFAFNDKIYHKLFGTFEKCVFNKINKNNNYEKSEVKMVKAQSVNSTNTNETKCMFIVSLQVKLVEIL